MESLNSFNSLTLTIKYPIKLKEYYFFMTDFLLVLFDYYFRFLIYIYIYEFNEINRGSANECELTDKYMFYILDCILLNIGVAIRWQHLF